MRSYTKRLFVPVTGVLLIVLGLFASSVPIQAASDAKLYLAPSSSSVEINKSKSYSLKIKTGSDSVDSVQAEVTFDTSKLSFVSANVNTAKFPFIVDESHSGGKITIVAGSASQVSGDVVAATIVLKAKVGSGSTSVGITKSNSYAVKGGVDRLGSTTGASLSLTSPAPDPDPTPTPTPSPSPSPSPSPDNSPSNPDTSTPTAPEDKKPSLTSGEINKVGFNTAGASINTDESTKAALLIGLSSDDLRVAVQSKGFSKSHDFSLGKNYLAPGNTFYYRFIITDKDGNRTKSEIKTFSTKGYPVTVQLTDVNGDPVSGWDVSLFSDPQTAKTDSDGNAVFENTPAGTHTLQVQVQGETYTQEIKIEDSLNSTKGNINVNASPAAQSFAFAVTQEFPTDLSIVTTIFYLLAALIGFFILLILFRRTFLMMRSMGTKGVIVGNNTQATYQNPSLPGVGTTQAPTTPAPGNQPPVTPQGGAGSVYMPTNDPNQPPTQSPTQSNKDGHKRL